MSKKHKNAYALLGIIQSHAPDLKAQEQVSQTYNNVLREASVTLEVYMAGMLYDGLAFGNWPWTRRDNE